MYRNCSQLLLYPSPCLLLSFLHTPSLRDLDVSSYLCSQLTTPSSLPSFMLTCVTAPARREEKYVDVSEHAELCVFTSELQLYDQSTPLTRTVPDLFVTVDTVKLIGYRLKWVLNIGKVSKAGTECSNPVCRINVAIVRFLQNRDMLKLCIFIRCIFFVSFPNFMLWQCCASGQFRFRHKSNLVRVAHRGSFKISRGFTLDVKTPSRIEVSPLSAIQSKLSSFDITDVTRTRPNTSS